MRGRTRAERSHRWSLFVFPIAVLLTTGSGLVGVGCGRPAGEPPEPSCELLDGQPDLDQDGVHDDCDNCPTAPNAHQVDTNEDGIGDACQPRLLAVEGVNRYPTRLAQGPDDRFFVSDAQVGSVFIYSPDLALVGELKGFDRPLGVVVDEAGAIYVGDDARDGIEVYDAQGAPLRTIGDGVLQMPNDLVLDTAGNLYVVDSLANVVRVFDPLGAWLRDIGAPGDGIGELRFPISVAVADRGAGDEVFVADQGHNIIHVFDLQGNFLRAFGGQVEAFSSDWEGKFVKLQSLAMDGEGRLHVADSYMNKVQILDAGTGAFVDAYGGFGTAPGTLSVPLDIVVASDGKVAVTNSGRGQVEFISPAEEP